MPNRDGTGPLGKGPKTGRQMGPCKDADPNNATFNGRGMGRGFGRRKGRGYGRGYRWAQQDNQE